MKQLMAFIRKELLELTRTGKLAILIIVFVLFGIMNPAVAKLTPWMMGLFADSLEETGMVITQVEVNALTSWTQFYKNMPMALIIFILMFSGSLTTEYQRGTLVNMVTKGLGRWKIILSKAFVMILMWTVCYWLSYGITLAYNVIFWDNSMVPNLFFGPLCFYLSGIWAVSLILLISSLAASNAAVLLGTGGMFMLSYLLGMIPALSRYMPTRLLDSGGLLTGVLPAGGYLSATAVVLALSASGIAAAAGCFNSKAL